VAAGEQQPSSTRSGEAIRGDATTGRGGGGFRGDREGGFRGGDRDGGGYRGDRGPRRPRDDAEAAVEE